MGRGRVELGALVYWLSLAVMAAIAIFAVAACVRLCSLDDWPARDELVRVHFAGGPPDGGWWCSGDVGRHLLTCTPRGTE
jgi:hypothetical protein